MKHKPQAFVTDKVLQLDIKTISDIQLHTKQVKIN